MKRLRLNFLDNLPKITQRVRERARIRPSSLDDLRLCSPAGREAEVEPVFYFQTIIQSPQVVTQKIEIKLGLRVLPFSYIISPPLP